MKHANAKILEITIAKDENKIMLYSIDDGIGAVNINYSNGLTGMEERVKEVNGTIKIHSEPNKGFEINISIPTINE